MTNRINCGWSSSIRNLCNNTRSIRQSYKLPEGQWSLSELKILSNNSDVIKNNSNDKNSMDIEKLCKLSCIDIDIGSISSKVTKDEILRDVNIILNCAKSLNVDNDIDSINDNEKVMLLSSLRDDIPTTTDSSSILINSQEKHKNFFAVPKRAKQELEE